MKVLKYGKINDTPRGWEQEELWRDILYQKWSDMWERVYTDINYFGKTIQPKYKYFSGYVEDIMKLENFVLFKENPYGWSIDKDIKGGTHIGYYFQYLSLVSISENNKEMLNRVHPSQTEDTKLKISKAKAIPIIGINKIDNTILIFKSAKDAKDKGFTPSSIGYVCKGIYSQHRGYIWYYLDMNDRVQLKE